MKQTPEDCQEDTFYENGLQDKTVMETNVAHVTVVTDEHLRSHCHWVG
jgi:hypothetical protein